MSSARLVLLVAVAACSTPSLDDRDPPDGGIADGAPVDIPRALPTCTHHVATTGSDVAGTGTAARPWRTVQFAMSSVGPGAVVCLAPGTYLENVLVTGSGTQALPITLTRDPSLAGEVILDGTVPGPGVPQCWPAIWFYGASNVRMVRLTITAHGNAGFPGPNYGLCTSSGVYVTPDYSVAGSVSDGIELVGNTIRDISTARTDQLGIAVSVSSYTPGRAVKNLRILDNTFLRNDTMNDATGIEVGALSIDGDVHDFEIRGNTFDDTDTSGVEMGGNQGNNLAPNHGVIADNTFVGSGYAIGSYGVYLQAARYILVERNLFEGTGNGVGVLTEPPCGVTDPVLAGFTLVRDNVFIESRDRDVLIGAFAGSNACPPLGYQAVDSVYVTNNTMYRTRSLGMPSIYAPANGSAGITGDSKILDNLIITDGRLVDVMPGAGAGPVVDNNYYVTPRAAPFVWNLADETFDAWRARGNDPHSTLSTSIILSSVFTGPVPSASGFHLRATAPQPPRDAGSLGGSAPSWAAGNAPFGAFSPTLELDFYGGSRDRLRRDIGADEY